MSAFPIAAPIPDPNVLTRRSVLALHVRSAESSNLPIATVPSIVTPTFTRASENVGRDRNGRFYVGAHSQPVLECYDLDEDGVFETPTLVFDDARSNLVPYATDHTQWTTSGTITVTANADSLGELPLTRLQDTSGANVGILQSLIMTSRFAVAGNGVVLGYVAIGQTPTAGASALVLRDSTNSVNRMELSVAWSGTAPIVSAVTGTFLWARAVGTSKQGRVVWEIAGRPTGTLTSADHKLWYIPASTSGDTGDLYVAAGQVEDLTTVPSALVFNAASTVATYNREVWGVPFDAYCGPMAFWLDFIERGSIYKIGARLLTLGSSGATQPEITINVNSGVYRILHHNGTTGVQSQALSAPAIGDRVQIYAVVNPDGSVQISQAIISYGQRTFVDGALSASNAFGATWSGFSGNTNLYLGHPYVNGQATRLIEAKVAVSAKTRAQIESMY